MMEVLGSDHQNADTPVVAQIHNNVIAMVRTEAVVDIVFERS